MKPSEAKERLSSGQDAACTQAVRFGNQERATIEHSIGISSKKNNNTKQDEKRVLEEEGRQATYCCEKKLLCFLLFFRGGGILTFTDLLWSPWLVRPQEVLLETRRSLEVGAKTNRFNCTSRKLLVLLRGNSEDDLKRSSLNLTLLLSQSSTSR